MMDSSKERGGGSSTNSRRSKDEGGKKRKSGDPDTKSNEEYAEAAQFFFEDEVYKLDRRKGRVKFGVVTDTFVDSYSGDEEEEDVDILNRGEVRITYYPEGKEVVQSENSIGLADRTLLPGDVVRRIVPGKKSTSGQSGYVREINMKVDVKVLGTRFVIANVPCERLRSIQEWSTDTAVCMGSWVGSTINVEEKAILKSFTGARIELSSPDFYRFSDLHTVGNRDDVKANVFFPGNIIYGRLPLLDRVVNLTPEITLPTNKKGRPVVAKYTVESLTTESITVVWQCRAFGDGEDDPQTEPDEVVMGPKLNELRRINNYECCMLQIQDRAYMKFNKCDKLIKVNEWEEAMMKKYQALSEQQNSRTKKYEDVPEKNKKTSDVLEETQISDDKAENNNAETTKSSNKGSRLRKIITRGVTQQKEKAESSSNQTQKLLSAAESIPEEYFEFDECIEIDLANENSNDETTSTVSTPRFNSRHLKRRHVKKKIRNIRRTLASPFLKKEVEPKDGDEIVVEILLVYSTVTVVWQDGTIELGIPSTNLFPIHHLDNHEFFPGDYVCSSKEEIKPSQREYGIIQHVDHDGRTGVVKWFTTYVNMDSPYPIYNGQTELSVYDLKDHPDFQFRPGTMVIRVANFVGDDQFSTAGQIIDNYPDGRIKVWWVLGHITMCYPQDLFEVAQADPESDAESDEDSDQESWETQSERSDFGSDTSSTSLDRQQYIIAGIDSARDAMKRLHRIVQLSDDEEKPEIVKELLSVYKNCRFFDRLMHTDFFHENNFPGILCIKAATPKKSAVAEEQKVNDETSVPAVVTSNSSSSTTVMEDATSKSSITAQAVCKCTHLTKSNSHLVTFNLRGSENVAPNEFSPKIIINVNSRGFHSSNIIVNPLELETTPTHNNITDVATPPVGQIPIKRKSSIDVTITRDSQRRKTSESSVSPMKNDSLNTVNSTTSRSIGCQSCAKDEIALTDNELIIKYKNEYFDNLKTAKTNIAKAFEIYPSKHTKISEQDSGNYSRTENGDDSPMSYNSANEMDDESEPMTTTSQTEFAIICPETIETFCVLINDQMEKCKYLMNSRYKKSKRARKSHHHHHHHHQNDRDQDHAHNQDQDQEEEQMETDNVIDSSESVDISSLEISESNDKEKNGEADPTSEDTATTTTTTTITTTSTTVSSSTEVNQQDPSKRPLACTSPSLSKRLKMPADENCFEVLSKAPKTHRFCDTAITPLHKNHYQRAVQREYKLMKTSLPPGVKVRAYEDRMDLLSVMMEGPKNTPYEDALFFFDIQMVRDYPKSPPSCHYISYCIDRLNPNLYEEGKVCVSLLGTWTGRDTEVWTSESTLLQLLVSIQGLILVDEPYYNEAGYEKQRGSQHGQENSQMYNEMTIIKVLQSTIKQIENPPEIFRTELLEHFKAHGNKLHERIDSWVQISQKAQTLKVTKQEFLPKELTDNCSLPPFPFLPCSRGCCLALENTLKDFKRCLDSIAIDKPNTSTDQLGTIVVDNAEDDAVVLYHD